jgi:hypothetical protein
LGHLMELLGNVGEMEARFGPFGDIINLDAWLMYDLCRMYQWRGNHFGRNRLYSYMTLAKWKLVLVHLGILLILMQDRCMVCAEHTVGSKIILGATVGTPTWRGSSGNSFRSIWR